ncbi:hypothetical protein [Prevotella sp. S7-1-8]|uniref:hypothetical protein n=1 Tax=Prevotella sp. S7-1-8 TaxID=1284775 RepID=UPI0012E09702|nr:hypothetical protein [Prevotella sp. S7-1-8]
MHINVRLRFSRDTIAETDTGTASDDLSSFALRSRRHASALNRAACRAHRLFSASPVETRREPCQGLLANTTYTTWKSENTHYSRLWQSLPRH